MASRKIIGTTHIRRKLSKKAKAAIAAIAVLAVGIGGFLFVNNTDAGAGIKNKVAGMSVVTEEGGFGGLFGAGNTPAPATQSIIKIDTYSRTVDEYYRDINCTGGYVSGGGTLREGDILEFNIKPFDGYSFKSAFLCDEYGFRRWVDPVNNVIKIGYYKNYSEDFVPTQENGTLEVYFTKDDKDYVNYTLNTFPQIGKYTRVKAYVSGGSSDERTLDSPEVNFNKKKENPYTRILADWNLTYNELESYFSYTQETYSFGDNTTNGTNNSKTDTNDTTSTTEGSSNTSGTTSNDTIVVKKIYSVAYDVYVFNKEGRVVYSLLNNNCMIPIQLYDIKTNPHEPKQITEDINKEHPVFIGDQTYSFDLDNAAVFADDCTVTIIPHTKDGSAYQVITKAEPSNAGATYGDRTSGEPFTTTISAEPATGFKFDRWTLGDNSDMSIKDKTLTVTPKGMSVYTAHFIPEIYNVELESVTPWEGGAVIGTGDHQAHRNVPITLKPSEGYKVESWNYTTADGSRYSGDSEEFLIKDLSSDIKLNVKFTNGKARIDVKASPVNGGTVTVENIDSKNGKKSDYEEFVPGKDSACLEATTAENYIFLYWEDSKGKKYDGITDPDSSPNVNKLTLSNVASSETFTAVFGIKNVRLNVKVDPSTIQHQDEGDFYVAGGFKIDYTDSNGDIHSTNPYYVETNIDNIKGGTTVKITAVEKTGYHFSKFVDTDGNVYNENPLVYPDLIENKEVEVIYVPDTFTISAQATPVIGGTVNVVVLDPNDPKNTKSDREGSNTVSYNDKVKIIAKPNPGFVFRYFEDQHGTKYSGAVYPGGAHFIFNAVSGDETFKVVFGKEEVDLSVTVDPKYKEDDKYVAGGFKIDYTDKDGNPVNVDPTYKDWKTTSSGNKKIKGQTSVKITALDGDGYHFSKFVDTDGNTYTDNPLIYPDLVENKDVEIIFVPDRFTINAKSSPVTGGTVDVAILDATGTVTSRREGSNEVSYNEKVRIIAKPNSNFAFRYFEDPSGAKYGPTEYDDSGNPYFEFNAVNGAETYKAVFAISNITLDVKVDPKNVDDSGNYIAGGFRIDYTDIGGNPTIVPATYEPKTVDNIKGQTSVKITALDGDGYHFSKFVDTDGNVYTENPLVYPALVENKDVEIIFVPDRFTINAKSVPVTGGTVDVAILDATSTVTSRREGSNEVSYNEKVRIIAKPNSNFAFRYFEDPNGAKYGPTGYENGNPYFEFNAVNGAETYKAVFAMSNVSLTMKVDPATLADGKYEAGKFKVNYTYVDADGHDVNTDLEGDEPGFKITNIKGQTSVKITAIELGGYKFSKFIDSEGNIWNDNPMVLGDLIENKEIEVIFVKEHWKIEGVSSPEAGGKVTLNGVESGVDVDYGDHVTIKATANPGYRFKYFKDELGNEFIANPIDFDAINGSEKYTAYFAKDDVSITLDLAPEGAGTVRFNSEPAVSKRTKYQTGGKSSVTLTATPKEDVSFLYWRDQDGKMYNDNPLALSDISADLIFTAVFDTKYDTVRALASPASGGKIRKIVNDDGSITLIAIANRGYLFTNWKKDNTLLTMGTTYKIPADKVKNGDVYTAYFKKDSNYDLKSDITKEKFYREWRKVITPNYTVTRDSMKLLAMQTVAGLRQYDDATPPLRTYGAVANAQAYFDEKTARDAARLDGVFGDAELMSAEGDVLRPDELPDADKYQKDAEDFTDRKFGDLYETEILTVKRVLEPDDFDNIKRTYLWRYTGAEYKDNIYLLYNIGGKKPDWATPIVDEDGVLKFTIDELDNYDVVAVVRVKIKEQ